MNDNSMEQLRKGQYSGEVTAVCDLGDAVASVTTYQQDHFNGLLHYHDNAHISFVLSGGCVERKKEAYERVPGNITYFMAGEPHQTLRVSRFSQYINLEFEEGFFGRYDLSDHSFFTAVTKKPELKFLMVKMYRELATDDTLSALSMENLLLNLLYQARQPEHDRKFPGWLVRLQEILYDRWNEKITLGELSLETGVHPVTISHYFPKYFSCTLGEYLRKLKVEKALGLIRSSDRSLTEIAYQCGFSDQSHFIKTFKSYTHLLPEVYKKL
jgi:AraC family transcriptional regulator